MSSPNNPTDNPYESVIKMLLSNNSKKGSILLVDSSPVALAIAKQALIETCVVYLSPSCQDALPIIKSISLDLVLLDIRIDDLESSAIIRLLSTLEIPFVFSGEYEDSENEIMAFDLGAVDFVHKPFVDTVLAKRIAIRIATSQAIKNLENQTQASIQETKVLETETEEETVINEADCDVPNDNVTLTLDFKGHKILVAEDTMLNQMILSAILDETSIEIDFADNGISAVDMFSASPDNYSLILMDINMPEMDGYTATEKIRALSFEQAKKIPIIAMTADSAEDDIAKCTSVGMNAHLEKPLDMEKILKTLSQFLH